MDIQLELAATEKTPAVSIRPEQGIWEITGCSIPENADRFYSPIQDRMERYALAPRPKTTLRIALTYFNSSTSKYLLDLMKRMEDLHAAGLSQVVLEWCYSHEDLDMKEAGEDYRSLLDFPVKLKEIDE
ncbi:MAG: DUF1987 domain-containing protein [Flavobacteriales bacterium]|nr:DUF1987 domain-containing protein [Flavobacteriales bacterium]